MGRLYELFFIAVFVWMIYRRLVYPFLRGAMRSTQPPTSRSQNTPPPPGPQNFAQQQRQTPPIDRSNVKDADFRDID